jgi:outer membrane receptor protein involved in Fe transport
MFTYIIFVTLITFGISASGQTGLRGVVADASAHKPIADVHVRIAGSNEGTVTGKDGVFTLAYKGKLPVELKASILGFCDTSIIYSVPDTIFLRPKVERLKTVVVSADRHERNATEIPQRIEQVSEKMIQQNAVRNADEILYLVSGVFNDRNQGIYSRNAGVTMRGMNSTSRVLVLYDGAPLNKADGGGINWNRIDPDFIGKVEVVKGPASAIYGGNAFAGVVHILPPDSLTSPFRLKLNAGYGSFNTCEVKNSIAAQIPAGKGKWFLILNNMYRKGGGFYQYHDSLLTQYDTTLFIREYGSTIQTGYRNKVSSFGIIYSIWDDIRSDGVKVNEPLGSYNKFTTHFAQTKLTRKAEKGEWLALAYFQKEDYFRQNESVSKKNGKYKYYDIVSPRTDAGTTISRKITLKKNGSLVAGGDFRHGFVNAKEIYYTSTDVFIKKGSMSQAAGFVQYDQPLLKKKLIALSGIRFDYARFSNGDFSVETPSASSEFINAYPVDFSDNGWTAVSPKLGLRYLFNSLFSAYISYSHGFRPPMLDDMCTNRSITKGFKIANPKLLPERLQNIEAGLDLMDYHNFTLKTAVWHSLGKDFQYFVFTGDSVDTGGESEKAVMLRDNIAEAEISGFEISAIYRATKSITLIANYTFSHSVISDFSGSQFQTNDITGKFIMEVPPHLLNAFATYENKYGFITLQYSFVDKRWANDENSLYSPAYSLFNIKAGTSSYKGFSVSVTIHDLFDKPYADSNNRLSPGRIVMINVQYVFEQK